MLMTLLFFVVAMGFSIYCWKSKQGLLGLLSFLLWFMFTMYAFSLRITQWDLHYNFGMLGVLMALIMIITAIYMIVQKNRIPGEEELTEEQEAARNRAMIELNRATWTQKQRKQNAIRRGTYHPEDFPKLTVDDFMD